MAIDDAAIFALAEYSTEMPLDKIEDLKTKVADGGNPRDAKLEIAFSAVEMLFGAVKAEKSKQRFLSVFSKHEKPSEMPVKKLEIRNWKLADLLIEVGMASSKGEARRLIEQGAVKINDAKKTDSNEVIEIKGEILLQVGKRNFLKIYV